MHAKLTWPVLIVAVIIVAVIAVKTINSSSAFTIVPPPGAGGNYKLYVATNGSDNNSGKTVTDPLRSIEMAVKKQADIVVLVGAEYQLPMESEHTEKGPSIKIEKPLLIISNQTPWEQAPSSSQGGFTVIKPPRAAGRQMNDYHLLKLAGKYNTTVDKLTLRFVRFSDTELRASMMMTTTYQGD